MKRTQSFFAAAAAVVSLFMSACSGALITSESEMDLARSISTRKATDESAKRVTGYFCEWGIYAAHGNYFPQNINY